MSMRKTDTSCAGVDIITPNIPLTIGEKVKISCVVPNSSADSVSLLRDGQTFLMTRNITQLNVTISVNDSLHGSQFSCEAQLTGSETTAYSGNVTITVEGNN